MATAHSPADLRRLIAALGGPDEIAREAAIARLAILGTPAADRLVAAWPRTPDRRARAGILQALERAGDSRLLDLAREAVRDGGDLAVAAAGVLRSLADAPDRTTAVDALDTLMGLVLDDTAERRVRAAAAEGLASVDGLDPRAVEAIRRASGVTGGAPHAVWQDALEGRLPDDPATLREAVRAVSVTAPLLELQRAVDLVRGREREATADARREWTATRGALHQALALRGSRLAIYDLRESLEAGEGPLPPSFLAALHAIGDATCLEALATAWVALPDARWRAQLREAFQAIARRERLTRRSAVLKRLAARQPAAFAALSA